MTAIVLKAERLHSRSEISVLFDICTVTSRLITNKDDQYASTSREHHEGRYRFPVCVKASGVGTAGL